MKDTSTIFLTISLQCIFLSLVECQWVRGGLAGTSISGLVLASEISGPSYFFAGTNGNGIYRCTAGDTSWTPVDSGLTLSLTDYGIFTLTLSGTTTNVFAGCSRGVYRTTDIGASWEAANSGLQGSVTSLVVGPNGIGGSSILASTFFWGVYRSTDNGSSWTQTNSGLGSLNVYTLGIVIEGTSQPVLFASTDVGVYRSTDNGASWNLANSGLEGTYVTCFAAISKGNGDTHLFAGTSTNSGSFRGIFVTTNNGSSWDSTGINNAEVYDLAGIGTDLFASVYNGLVRSTDYGATWNVVNTGLTADFGIYGVATPVQYGSKLFLATWDGIWQRPLSDFPTGVVRSSAQLPDQCRLEQNFPNPFNPATTISFSIPTNAFVSLRIFDALGREVANLCSEEMPEGTHTRHWNAATCASGVYFCRLQAQPTSGSSFTDTRKLILLR